MGMLFIGCNEGTFKTGVSNYATGGASGGGGGSGPSGCTYPLEMTQAEIDPTIYGQAGYKTTPTRDTTFQKWLLPGSAGPLNAFLSATTGTDLSDPLANTSRVITLPTGNFAFEMVLNNIGKGVINGGGPATIQTRLGLALTDKDFSQAGIMVLGVDLMEDGTFKHFILDAGGSTVNTVAVSGNTRLGAYYDAATKTFSYYAGGILIHTGPVTDLTLSPEVVMAATAVEMAGSTGTLEFDMVLDASELTGTYPAGTTDICGNLIN